MITICEDDKEQQNIIEGLIKETKFGDLDSLTKYSAGEDLVKAYEDGSRYDIIFLDMQMKLLDGIQTALNIRKIDSQCIIIIVTSIMEYAMQGYGIDAFEFVLKPIDKVKFKTVYSQAITVMNSRKDFVYVIEDRYKKVVLKLFDILYIESNARKVTIICKDNSYLKYSSISIEENELNGYGFVRISRYYLVNLHHVKEIQNKCLLLSNGDMLSISPKLRDGVYDHFTDYMMERV